PFTAPSKLSLVDHVHIHVPGGHKHVKPATWFVSHAWSYLYLDVVDALSDFFNEEGVDGDAIAVWFCMFNNNQHEIQGEVQPFQYWVDAFQSALKAIGNVVMVLSPWNNPTTLTRTWCVFEIYVAIVTKARFEVALGKAQKQEFLQDIQDDGARERMLATIKSETSQTAVASDRENILNLMTKANVKFGDLDRMLFDVLEQWILRMVQAQIETSPTIAVKARWLNVQGKIFNEKAQLDNAKRCYDEAISIYRNELNCNDPKMWSVVTSAAAVEAMRGQSRDIWAPMFEEAMARQTELFGKDSFDTLLTMYEFGARYYYTDGNLAAAMPLLIDCYERSDQHFGDSYTLAMDAMNAIGFALLNENELVESEKWLVGCNLKCRRTLGDDHPLTVFSGSNLGICYMRQGKYDLAATKVAEAYDSQLRTLGPDSESTWRRFCLSGQIQTFQGQYDLAEETLLACKDAGIRFSHSKHQNLCCQLVLGRLYVCAGKFEQAKYHLTTAFKGFKVMYGPQHMIIRQTLAWLCLLCVATNALDDNHNLENELKQAGMYHDTWSEHPCLGCYRPLNGLYFTCTKCPSHARRFCHACVKQPQVTMSFCDHGPAAIQALTPPARQFQEKRLVRLAHDAKWNEYEDQFQMYEKYCHEFHVPTNERLERAAIRVCPHCGGRCVQSP
ncbi:hypothetical protein As57867_004422, partial [Aphanomyces stellatus]